MKVKLIIISIILLLVMVFASGCIPVMEKLGLVNPVNEEQLSPEKGGPPDGLIKVLIGFKEKPGAAQQAMVKGVGGKIKYTYHIVDAIAASIPEKAIEALQKNPNIRYVELDGQVFALDGELDDSWGVKHIGAGLVHDFGNKGAGVKVAIIDSGIDYTHPDLSDNYIGGHDFVNDDDDPMDDNGHGTHVAGIVAALDNGDGVVGVAPAASLYALKVLDSGGRGDFSDVIAAIEWCEAEGIQVTNNSYGSSGDPGVSFKEAFDSASGILHVAAAGNSGNPPARGDNVGYPAAYESVIAVAATDLNDERARWSSTGPAVELAAPGVGIYSTYIGGGYATYSGTSMASPHVAGTVALMIAAGITTDIRNELQSTADDLGDSGLDWLYGYGLVDAEEAAGVIGGILDPPPAGGTMHVDSIDMLFNEPATAGPNKFYTAVATVTIVDGSSVPVEGAAVSGTWSGATNDTDSGVTDASGQVSLQSDKVKNPESDTIFTFTIDDVIKDEWEYDENSSVTTASESVP